MWLEEFRRFYPNAGERYIREHIRLDPKRVESELAEARGSSLIGKNVLETLEEQKDHWPYQDWWPKMSSAFDENERIVIPQTLQNLGRRKVREDTIRMLYKRFKSIECVSVLLRFLYPEEFGILSFPVSNLVSLAQARNPVNYYLDYLEVLRGFRDQAKYKSSHIQNVADIDMALWSAAHYSQDCDLEPQFALLRDEMFGDEYFQDVRFRNLLKGLGTHWNGTDSQYLLFARALLEHDRGISSLIVARVYENLIWEIGSLFGKAPIRKEGQTETGAMVHQLDNEKRMEQFGIQKGQLVHWWRDLRVRAVHDKPPPLDRREAQEFLNGIDQLQRGWTRAVKPKGR